MYIQGLRVRERDANTACLMTGPDIELEDLAEECTSRESTGDPKSGQDRTRITGSK